jgi:hypothetical protein
MFFFWVSNMDRKEIQLHLNQPKHDIFSQGLLQPKIHALWSDQSCLASSNSEQTNTSACVHRNIRHM